MSLELVKEFGSIGEQVNSVELSPDERLLAVASYHANRVCVYDAYSGEQMWSTNLQSFQAVFSPSCTQLAAADYSGKCVKIFRSGSGALLRTLGHTSSVYGVAWSSSGIVASASSDKTVRLWNPGNGTCLRALSGHSNSVRGVSFSPDGMKLASGSFDNTVRIWDVVFGNCLFTLTGHNESVWRVAFSPDGSKLASTSQDGTARVWDSTSDFKCIQIIPGAGGGYYPTIGWSPDSCIFATANETMLQLWDESGSAILQTLNQASALTFSRFSHEIITGDTAGKMCRWESPVTWSLFFDVKNGIPYGKLYLPSQSPHDVSGTLERISTIIERMDLPVAFHKLIQLLHELNHPSFVDMQTRARIARDLEQGFSALMDQQQSLSDTRNSLHQKATYRQQLAEVKEDLVKLESSEQFISLMKEYVKKYTQVQQQDDPPSEDTSFKQHEHSSPRDLSESELEDILSFSRVTHAKLARLEQTVTDTARSFEKALLDYDQYSAEIREQSEKNADAIMAFLAYRPSTSISSERIAEIEKVLSELKVTLDNDRDIMSKLDRSQAEFSSAKDQLNKSLEEQRSRKEQIEMQAASERRARDSQAKGSSWIQMLSVFGKSASAGKESTEDVHQQPSPPPPPIDVNKSEHLRQLVEQAKSNLKSSTEGIEHHAHIVYKWLNDHPDAKLDAAEVFDMIGTH